MRDLQLTLFHGRQENGHVIHQQGRVIRQLPDIVQALIQVRCQPNQSVRKRTVVIASASVLILLTVGVVVGREWWRIHELEKVVCLRRKRSVAVPRRVCVAQLGGARHI
jgi:predicted RNA-binding protein YlqC (UPF0109 family)